MVLVKTLESPLDCKEILPVHPKGDSPECSLEGLMLKLQYFGHLMQRADSFEKTLMLGRLRAGGGGEDRGWDGWMASPTQWTWVRASSNRSWWRTGKLGVLQSMGLQRVGHNWVTELNKVQGQWGGDRVALRMVQGLSWLTEVAQIFLLPWSLSAPVWISVSLSGGHWRPTSSLRQRRYSTWKSEHTGVSWGPRGLVVCTLRMRQMGRIWAFLRPSLDEFEGAEDSTESYEGRARKVPSCEGCGQRHADLNCLSLLSLVSQLVTYVGFDFYL